MALALAFTVWLRGGDAGEIVCVPGERGGKRVHPDSQRVDDTLRLITDECHTAADCRGAIKEPDRSGERRVPDGVTVAVSTTVRPGADGARLAASVVAELAFEMVIKSRCR